MCLLIDEVLPGHGAFHPINIMTRCMIEQRYIILSQIHRVISIVRMDLISKLSPFLKTSKYNILRREKVPLKLNKTKFIHFTFAPIKRHAISLAQNSTTSAKPLRVGGAKNTFYQNDTVSISCYLR